MATQSFPGFDDISLTDLRRRRGQKWGRASGETIAMSIAEMDFPVADPIAAVLREAVAGGDFGYIDAQSPDLGAAFAGFAHRQWGWSVDPAEVIPITDVMVGIAEVLRRLTVPGDRVIVTPPVYPPFFLSIAQVGCVVSEAPLARSASRFELDLDAIDREFRAGARVLLLCNPHNPTGRVFSRDELLALADLAPRHDATIVMDEIHSPLVLDDGVRHQPFVALGGEAARRGISVTSASKGWNLAALKCAVVVAADGPMREVTASLPGDTADHTGYLGWLATCAAWNDGEPWLAQLLDVLRRNRNMIAQTIQNELPEVQFAPPEAGYLAWLDVRNVKIDGDPCDFLRDTADVALTPGSDFGRQGTTCIRLNFATSQPILSESLKRISHALSNR